MTWFRHSSITSPLISSCATIGASSRGHCERANGAAQGRRQADDSALKTKPNEQAPWTYQEWLKVLAFHEAHHQGQPHLTFNLYKAAHGIK